MGGIIRDRRFCSNLMLNVVHKCRVLIVCFGEKSLLKVNFGDYPSYCCDEKEDSYPLSPTHLGEAVDSSQTELSLPTPFAVKSSDSLCGEQHDVRLGSEYVLVTKPVSTIALYCIFQETVSSLSISADNPSAARSPLQYYTDPTHRNHVPAKK